MLINGLSTYIENFTIVYSIEKQGTSSKVTFSNARKPTESV